MSTDPEQPRDLNGATEVTGALMMQQLRLAVSPAGKKGTWLRLLSDKQLAEVYHRLKLKQPSYKIAQIAQQEWGIRRRAAVKSLARGIRKFKADTLGLLQVEKTAPSAERRELGKKLEEKALRLVEKVDAMGRLGWLIDRQTERVSILIDREKTALPFKFTGDEIQTLSDIIEKYMNLQIKLGLVPAKPPELNLNVKHRFDSLMGSVQSGNAVIEAADKWLQRCEEEALTLKVGPDGHYQLIKEDVDNACETTLDKPRKGSRTRN